MYRFVYFIIILSFSCTSCCTMHRSPYQEILITASPEQGNVTVDGYDCGMTPVNVQVTRKQNHIINISKEGYEAQTIQLRSVKSLKFLYNLGTPLAIGGLGCAAGAASGCIATGGAIAGLAILVGLGAGIGGLVMDSSSGASYDLYCNGDKNPCPTNIDFLLQQAPFQP